MKPKLFWIQICWYQTFHIICIRIRLAGLNFFFLLPDFSNSNSLPCWLSQFSWMQQKKISMGPILFLYYKESLVSTNLNSKLFRFHSAHPNLHTQYPSLNLTYFHKILLATTGKWKRKLIILVFFRSNRNCCGYWWRSWYCCLIRFWKSLDF